MKKILVILFAFVFAVTATGTVDAKKKKKKKSKYKVIEVTDGGSISGTAVFAGGTPPADETLELTSEQSLCGNTLPARKYVINGNNEIKNAVVYLDGIKKGKKVPNAPVVIDNKLCAFEPHVSVGFAGKDGKAVIKNSDPVFHNTHSYIKGRTVFNLGLPDQGSEVEKKMKRPGVMSVKCDSHPWMLGYVFLSNHPYAVVTNKKGEFSITDIPAGSYKVKAWHEGFGDIELGEVTVDAGKTVMVKAEFK
jgi:hypothetical protein